MQLFKIAVFLWLFALTLAFSAIHLHYRNHLRVQFSRLSREVNYSRARVVQLENMLSRIYSRHPELMSGD